MGCIYAAYAGCHPKTFTNATIKKVIVDATGAAALSEFFNYAQRNGIELSLARMHSGAHKLLQLAGVMAEIGEQRIYDTVRNAVDAAIVAVEAEKLTDTNINAPL